MNVLITSASRKVSLVRAFQEALNRCGGGLVIPVDASPYSAALYESPVRFLVPESHDPAFLPTLLDICRRQRVGLVVPTRDEELPVFARHRGLFEAAGIRIMVASPETIELCQDKRLFFEFCRREGFPVPRAYSPAELRENPAVFPVFVRGRKGKSGRWAFKVETPGQLEILLARLEEPLVQEFVAAPEYTVDLFSDFEGRVISVVPRRRLRVVGGESFVGVTCYHELIIQECCRLARKLHVVGHNTIQCFFDGHSVKFIEVNPRYGGGAALSFAAGAHTPTFLVRLVKGLPVAPCIGEFERGLVMLRYTEDRFVKEDRLLRDMQGGDGS